MRGGSLVRIVAGLAPAVGSKEFKGKPRARRRGGGSVRISSKEGGEPTAPYSQGGRLHWPQASRDPNSEGGSRRRCAVEIDAIKKNLARSEGTRGAVEGKGDSTDCHPATKRRGRKEKTQPG